MTGYRTCIFDLYGTLVDIHTDENAPQVWEALAAHYSARGAVYRPKELRDAYFRAEIGRASCRERMLIQV